MALCMVTLLVLGAIIAAYADVRTRRIPNLLTGALALSAVGLNIPAGWTGVATAALVILVAFIAGTLAFSLGWFGGGDVKLLAACCGLAGYPGSIDLVLFTLMAGGVFVLVDAASKRRLRTVVTSTYHASLGVRAQGRTTIPYAVAIAAGASAYALSALTPFRFLRLPL